MKRRLFALLPFLLLCGCAAHRKPATMYRMDLISGGTVILSTGCAIPEGQDRCAAPGSAILKPGDTLVVHLTAEKD